MKKQVVIFGVILLLISVWISGCEYEFPETPEIKKDYVEVLCCAWVYGHLLDKNNNNLKEFPIGLPIKVDFIKDGGERFTLQCAIDKNGSCFISYVTFKLYKEQPIEAVMTVQGGYRDYDPIRTVQSRTLTWETVIEHSDFGERYFWEPRFDVYLQNNTIL